MADKPETQPWDKQPHEQSRPFGMFVVYRDMGPARTLVAVAEQFGLANQTVRGYSMKWRWPERVSAWDRYIDQIKQQEMRVETVEIAKQHAAFAAKMLGMAAKRLDKFDKADTPFTPTEVRQWVTDAVDLHRLALGMPTETTGIGGVADDGKLTQELPRIEVVFVRPEDAKK